MRFYEFRQRLTGAVVTSEIVLMIASLILTVPLDTACAQQTDEQAETKSTEGLPSGEEVMKQHMAKTGGKDAYDKIQNRFAEGTLEIVGQGVSIDMKTWSARPNKVLVKIDSELTGKIEKGCDGKVIWENTLVGGPVIHEGDQRANGLRDSTFERFVYWDTIYDTAECVGEKKIGDRDCYEVVLTPPAKEDGSENQGSKIAGGSPMRVFIDKEDYLIRKIHAVIISEAGKIEVEAYPEDYRKVDDIMLSHKIKMNLLGQNRLVTVNNVKHNIKLPDNHFDLPDEVKELVEK